MIPSLFSIILSLFSLLFGVITICLVFTSKKRTYDKGIIYFLFSLTPFLLFSFSEHLRLISLLTGNSIYFFASFSRFVRLFSGLGWVLYCHKHFVLNEILDFRRSLTLPIILITVANSSLFLVLLLAGNNLETIYRLNILIMSLTSFYAGLSAILLVVKKNTLLRSSWAGIRVAAVSMVIYPFAIVSDVFGFTYPFFDPTRLVWEQIFPYYFILICVLIFPLFFNKKSEDDEDATCLKDSVREVLTRRESEIICLLVEGKSYKEISDDLQISISTVKTHISNAYRKLGITHQRELDLIIHP